MNDALVDYRTHLIEKGNKLSTVTTTMHRLDHFFGAVQWVNELSPVVGKALYREYTKGRKPATHHAALKQARTFCRWMGIDALDKVETIGRPSKGKKQLRVDEARAYVDAARRLRPDRAAATLLPLLCNLRAGEVSKLRTRDVDDGCQLVWVVDAKTPAGNRVVAIPEVLQPILAELRRARVVVAGLLGLAGHGMGDVLVGHSREWVRDWCYRVCDRARVPRVSPHGLRPWRSKPVLPQAKLLSRSATRTTR